MVLHPFRKMTVSFFSFFPQLFPYHLSDVIVKGLRITPFSYYRNIMENIMSNERSYDSLPNFTAADCECKSFKK